MKRLKAVLATGAATLAATGAMLAGAGTAHADTQNGCPDGYVCIYAQDQPANPGTLTNSYYRYGTYNLSNQYGWHWIDNNQTGGAHVTLCYGYNGTNCQAPLGPGWYAVDLGPINSIIVSS